MWLSMNLTILMPCLNESETLATCIAQALSWARLSNLEVEVLVADNGSTDGSIEIAEAFFGEGVRVINVLDRGYGSALYAGCAAATGQWIIIGDADCSYSFADLDPFTTALGDGAELVMGNRFLGGIEPGAMPWKNRYLGNPVLSSIGRLLFGVPVRDFHCGLRGLTKEAFWRMDLRTTGMEFASEMVIKAAKNNLIIVEVPVKLHRDGRSRRPHLRPYRDGWRHLRFMLLFSPRWLFAVPGTVLFVTALALYILLFLGPLNFGDVTFDVRTLFFAQAGICVGLLIMLMSVVAKLFGFRDGLFNQPKWVKSLLTKPVSEYGALLGILCIIYGLLVGSDAVVNWGFMDFGPVFGIQLLRKISLSTLLLTSGGIILTFSLFIGFLSLPTRDSSNTTKSTTSN
jgi:glycosyltransferase involved in cell wall biosynthesis